ncbi:MAG: cytochrome c3 family protein [Verrucomicrobiota bacterium]
MKKTPLLTLKRWLQGTPRKTMLLFAGCAAVALTMISCGTLSQPIMAPPSIPGSSYAGSKACSDCHEKITRYFPTATHARLKAQGKNADNIGCESCHGPGSKHIESGGAANTILNPKKSPETCFQCHLDVRAKFNLPHTHPVLQGKVSCTDCHDPHKGDAKKGGGTSLMSANDTCAQCHTEQKGPFVFRHEAVRDGCTSCHDPHGTINPRMLLQRNASLCLKCHFQQQLPNTSPMPPGQLTIGSGNHTTRLTGACWSAGCHEAVHGSQTSPTLRY